MNAQGQPAQVSMTVQITRAATGLTETYELRGHIIPQPEAGEPQHPFQPAQPELFDTKEK